MAVERHRIFFAGHVQGVGFRLTTRRLARSWPVVGFVRNLADGRVELLVEGESAAVAGLLTAIHREFGGSIRDQDDTREPPGQPPVTGFSIT